MNQGKKLKILFVASEVSPFAKTGGLADVAGSLPQALAIMGHDVRIAMPKYRFINYPMETRLDFPVAVGDRKETAIIRECYLDANIDDMHKEIPVYFVDNYQYFDRDYLYCYFDEAERFAFFCRAVIEMLPGLDFQPDVIHCNDWQTGPIPVLLKDQYSLLPFYSKIATVYTVHNLFYQGNYPKGCLKVLGLGEEYFEPEKLEFYGNISFIKSGLVYSDIINTVSKTYAQEIQTLEYGERMEGLMQKRAENLYGIVNGINYNEFSPMTDPHIHKNYDIKSIENKKENKYALQKTMKLPVRDVPVFGLISRLVDQKGLDLIEEIFPDMIKNDVQFILLGTGDCHYEEFFKEMTEKYPDKFAAYIGYNATLAQQIYAGCDIFLMPSKFEPCGLGQLISLRYGTIPLVRATGGLADTVADYNRDEKKGNGFVFKEYASGELLKTVQRALKIYAEKSGIWDELVMTAMEYDSSWPASAREYIKLYHLAINKK
jgi:starch synthase